MALNTALRLPTVGALWPERGFELEPGRSSSTVGQSRESLVRGGQILQGVVAGGVVKTEEDDDEREIMTQIEAGSKPLSSQT